MLQMTLYSKTTCGLCEEAKQALSEFQQECNCTVDIVDISKDPSLWEKYQYEIPVLLINGQEAARHHLSLKKLRVLRQRMEAQPRPGASDSFPPMSASR